MTDQGRNPVLDTKLETLPRTPRVWNLRHGSPPGAIYIGRPSVWGNPYQVGIDGTRERVIELYREYLRRSPELLIRVREELAGRDLVCWCKPLPCHGDVLLELCNGGGI